ncbi:hypothetical protein [Actinomadura violacea]|uniref:Lipoprotein n=1 Tax=Actinomadura violacea TaxID=2819934 RepID=A0ABS3RQH6_9ACTN|nr:hypothetical protein [Actinomadura violacea]MBO2458999.1 hypothetical protein [Actinomadura violacea]
MRMRALCLAGLILLPAACADGNAGGTERPMDAAATGGPANPRVLDCENRGVSFPEEDDGPYRTGPDDLVAGPLIIPGLRAWADADPAAYGRDGRYKVAVVMRAGTSATLSIPAEHHRDAGLLYAAAARDARTPLQADHAITFTACAGHDTIFPGLMFVPRRTEVPLLVRPLRPASGAAVREVVSFFADRR